METIGEGGFGKVYLLRDYNPPIVMKEVNLIVDQNEQEKEMATLKELVHPNIVKYKSQPLDFAYTGTKYPIFMEFCEEGSLKNVITSITLNYSVATILKWAKEIFTALVYLKANGIAHRDIKPANIFVTYKFVLKVGDFGVIKRFHPDHVTAYNFAGTRLYMAPELEDGVRLSREEVFKCDVFAAGLVIWEVMERRNLTSQKEAACFSSTNCPNVKRLQNFVQSCSSPDLPIKGRLNAEAALEEVKSMESLFKEFPVEPERKRHQTCLKEPDGLCFIRDLICFDLKPPNPQFSENENQANPRIDDIGPKDQLNQTGTSEIQTFMKEWMSRIQRKTNFVKLIISNETFGKITDFHTIELGILKPEMGDVNDVRSLIVQRFLSSVDFDNMQVNEKRVLIEEIQYFYNHMAKKQKSKDTYLKAGLSFDSRQIDDYLKKRESLTETIASNLRLFGHLLLFDFNIQNLCIRFAVNVLWVCDSLALTWFELLKLLDASIQNIEEVERILTRRRHFSVHYLGNARTEWCSARALAFRKDLSEIRLYDEVKRAGYGMETLESAIIDLDTIRRALYEKRDSVEKYCLGREQKTLKLEEPLQDFLDRVNQQRRSYCFGLVKDFPRDYITYLPRSAKELIEKTLEFGGKTRFSGCLYFIDLIPCCRISPVCPCFPSCSIKIFPESAQIKNLQISYSSCAKLNQLEFLETHQHFERAFRLLHFWYDIQLYKHIFIYLIEELLVELEAKTDSSYGFYFMWMKEKAHPTEDRYPKFCHEGHEENGERSGLLIGISKPTTNSFWNRDFRLESATSTCLLEYEGLIYIALHEIRDLLLIMAGFLRNLEKVFNSKANEQNEVTYRNEMRNRIEQFWNEKSQNLLI